MYLLSNSQDSNLFTGTAGMEFTSTLCSRVSDCHFIVSLHQSGFHDSSQRYQFFRWSISPYLVHCHYWMSGLETIVRCPFTPSSMVTGAFRTRYQHWSYLLHLTSVVFRLLASCNTSYSCDDELLANHVWRCHHVCIDLVGHQSSTSI